MRGARKCQPCFAKFGCPGRSSWRIPMIPSLSPMSGSVRPWYGSRKLLQHAVGYIGVTEPRAGVAWISDLAVAPAWRRKGVATSLLATVHTWCGERQNRRVFIEMQSKNYPAIALAQKNDYEFCGYNDRYYSNQDVMLVFARAR